MHLCSCVVLAAAVSWMSSFLLLRQSGHTPPPSFTPAPTHPLIPAPTPTGDGRLGPDLRSGGGPHGDLPTQAKKSKSVNGQHRIG